VETIATYITSMAESGKKTATIQRHLATIAAAHKAQGAADPTKNEAVRQVFAGIKRTHGSAQTGRLPLLTVDLRAMIQAIPQNLLGLRDRLILLLGYAGAFRRSELVALTVDDLSYVADGVTITIRRSKTDQDGAGQIVGIPHGHHEETCPVLALQRWLEAAGITEGPIFRNVNRHGRLGTSALTNKVVALVVKRSAERVGLDPTKLGGHSLRAGLATQAAINGIADRTIMRQTRHKSHAVFSRYVRDTSLYRNNAAGSVGL
jgi:integrase